MFVHIWHSGTELHPFCSLLPEVKKSAKQGPVALTMPTFSQRQSVHKSLKPPRIPKAASIHIHEVLHRQ